MADKLAEARAAESAALAQGAVDVADDDTEIEMDAVSVDQAKRSSRRAAKRASKRASKIDAVIEKRESRRERLAREKAERADEKAAAKATAKAAKADKAKADKAKADKKADKADDKPVSELPANVANKTDTAMGKVSVTSSVPAMIYIDGRSTRMMTPQKIAVPAGKHTVTLLDPESKKAKTQDIEVVAGKSTSVDKTF
jgi:hypothetical protein